MSLIVQAIAERIAQGELWAVSELVSRAVHDDVMHAAGDPVWYVRRVRDGRWYGPGRFRWVRNIADARRYKTEEGAQRGAYSQAHSAGDNDMEIVRVMPLQLEVEFVTSKPTHMGPYAAGWADRLNDFLRELAADIDDMERDGELTEQNVRNRGWRLARHLAEEERPWAIWLNETGQVQFDDRFRERIAMAEQERNAP